MHHIRVITERRAVDQRWTLLLTRLLRRWLGGKWRPCPPDDPIACSVDGKPGVSPYSSQTYAADHARRRLNNRVHFSLQLLSN